MPNARIAIASLLMAAGAMPALAAGPEYSADAVETRPGLGNHAGRLLVRGSARRYEHQVMGLPVIEIELPEQGIRRIVFPLSRSYIEQSTAGLPAGATMAQPSDAPCRESPALACKRTGTAEIAGIATETWTLRPVGAPADSTIHWDPRRRIAVREEHIDGRRLEAARVATETYEGREVEHWRIVYRMPGGARLEGQALVDPDLGATIAERRPDGASRRLVNVTRGGVDEKLFTVPDGYRRMQAPGDPAPAARPPHWQPHAGAAGPAAPLAVPPAPPPPQGEPAATPAKGNAPKDNNPPKDNVPPPAAVAPTPQPGATGPAPAMPPATAPMPLQQPPQPAPSSERRAETAAPTPPGVITSALPTAAVAAAAAAAQSLPAEATAPGGAAAAVALPQQAGEVPVPLRKPAAERASLLPTAATEQSATTAVPPPARRPETAASTVTGATTAQGTAQPAKPVSARRKSATAVAPSAATIPDPGNLAAQPPGGVGAPAQSNRIRSGKRAASSTPAPGSNSKRRRKAR